ncbi:MAG: hypothetical protein QW567_02670 [Candidatus Hadarchaeales archaeon]
MKPWEVEETVRRFRRMSGSDSVLLGLDLSETAARIFANSMGKREPDAAVYELIRKGDRWSSKKCWKK